MVIVSDRAVPMTSTFGNTYFRSPAFGSQSRGSRVAGYAKTAVEVVEGGMNLQQQLQSISAMPVYKDKTTEELRWEDYKSGDKGGIGFGGWATRSNFFTASHLSSKPASNPFSSPPANIFAPQTLASASEGFGQSNTPAFSSFSPFGRSSSNPFSSDVGPSIAPAPSSSPFQASACPLFGANSSEPSLGTSSLPTFGPTPSVFSSSSSLCANCCGTSARPIFGANNSSGCFRSEPSSSISSNLGVPPNFVSHSLFGQTATAQVPVSQPIAPSFGINLLSQDFSSTPGRCCCVCPSNMSNTAFTGNGSAGNLLSSTRFAFPPDIYGVGQATTSSGMQTSSPVTFNPMQTANSTDVPVGVPVGHLPGFNGFLGIAYLPCWIAFVQPVGLPPGWVASAQSIAAPVTCNNPFHDKVAGTSTTTNGSPKFGQSAFGGNHGGSRKQAYTPTVDYTTIADLGHVCMLKSISAMHIYLNKSPEELRWEDYRSRDKGGPEPGIGSFQTAPSSFSSSTPSNLFASQKPAFTLPKFGVPTTPIFDSPVFAAPNGACPFGQSFATPFSSTSANLFASQTPVFSSADLVSPPSSFVSPPPFGMQSEKPFSSSSSTNSFAPSQLPCFASSTFGASTTAPLASAGFSAPFSPSPFGSPVNPFSSTPSIMFHPKSSSFGASSIGASAYPFMTPTSSTLCEFATESGSGFVANGSAPSLGASCSPTLGSSPSVSSSSFTFGQSSQPIITAHSTPVSRPYGSTIFGGPVPSIFSKFGSEAPNSVLPSAVSGESNFSFTPSIIPPFGALNISSTASTGNGSEGNLWSTCPTSTAGFDTTTSSATSSFQPVRTSKSESVPISNIGWSAAGLSTLCAMQSSTTSPPFQPVQTSKSEGVPISNIGWSAAGLSTLCAVQRSSTSPFQAL